MTTVCVHASGPARARAPGGTVRGGAGCVRVRIVLICLSPYQGADIARGKLRKERFAGAFLEGDHVVRVFHLNHLRVSVHLSVRDRYGPTLQCRLNRSIGCQHQARLHARTRTRTQMHTNTHLHRRHLYRHRQRRHHRRLVHNLIPRHGDRHRPGRGCHHHPTTRHPSRRNDGTLHLCVRPGGRATVHGSS